MYFLLPSRTVANLLKPVFAVGVLGAVLRRTKRVRPGSADALVEYSHERATYYPRYLQVEPGGGRGRTLSRFLWSPL